MKGKIHRVAVAHLVITIFGIMGLSCSSDNPTEFTLTKGELQNKIKGGWAGQVIGCTYGGPTEFKYRGTMIQEYIPIERVRLAARIAP